VSQFNRRHVRYFAFLLVGGTGFLLYLAISNALHYLLGVDESWAAMIGSALPIWPVYQLQRRFTFRGRESNAGSFPAYIALQAGNTLLIGLLSGLGANSPLPGFVVFVIAGLSGVVVSYVVQSKLIFRKRARVE